MKQRVPVAFVLILAVAFAVLLFFYFRATVDRYGIRVQNEVQSELLEVYYLTLDGDVKQNQALEAYKSRYEELDPVKKHIQLLDSFQIKNLKTNATE